ncbi:ubiquinone biosynthesis accessory factor UbiJ [Arsukibacterium sp.]|uniref:ubiquinone biosynthesis accessory factor UbiJ n=1 Tax=Arsukibacterium sp. TaxID=1977258 RepID=UPI002FD996D0
MFALLPQLLCAAAEKLVNQLIRLDPAAQQRLSRLQGKQLAFSLRELKLRLVISADASGLLFNQHDEAVDCAISTDLASLKLLADASQLTRLIKADALQIDGDIQVAQQYSAFFQALDPDWQQALSAYVGDALAHKMALIIQHLQHYLQLKTADLARLTTALGQEELRLSPSRLELQHFSEQVQQLAGKVAQLQRQFDAGQE